MTLTNTKLTGVQPTIVTNCSYLTERQFYMKHMYVDYYTFILEITKHEWRNELFAF